MKFHHSLIFLSLFVFSLLFWLTNSVSAQGGIIGGSGSGNEIVSRDAIGLRVVPNPEHHGPLQWYDRNIAIKGAPQSFIVDGYEAVRDGRTIYVNAANAVEVKRCGNTLKICKTNADCSASQGFLDGDKNGKKNFLDYFVSPTNAQSSLTCIDSNIPEIYTNIYVISHNQNPEVATTDIFGQLLQFWKFNYNVKTCSNDHLKGCKQDSDCVVGSQTATSSGTCELHGFCSETSEQGCLLSSDCPLGEFCLNKKSAVIRDVKRLSDLRLMKDRIEAYGERNKHYPRLESGTYLTNKTVSTWPSWTTTLANTIGGSVPGDPVNQLGPCGESFNPITCWDETNKRFAGQHSPLELPVDSKAYYYEFFTTPVNNNNFKFCSLGESGYFKGVASGGEICQTGDSCFPNCTNRNCGGDGCGGFCGTNNGNCPSGQSCSNQGVCQIAIPVGSY
ncbi:MAG: hypothetical protein QY321_02745 [Patescibacteria group bacterium]|nr:MAG: hypothetical protein QY321_02745 [Patescibacteria group bacterium]